MKDIYFDYDSYELTPANQSTLQANVAFLKSHPNMRFTVEGHCDERGSTEYNLALGENRANAVKQALVNLGHSSRLHQDHQLRQGKAGVHRAH